MAVEKRYPDAGGAAAGQHPFGPGAINCSDRRHIISLLARLKGRAHGAR
jgi:hypothetical protein